MKAARGKKRKKKKKENMQSVLVMFVAGLYPSGFQQPSENPTRLFVCDNACMCVCVGKV